MRMADSTGLGDGRNIILVNGAYNGRDELGDLISDLAEKNTKLINNTILAKRITEVKEGEKIMVETSFDRFLKEEKMKAVKKAEPRNP